MQNFRTLIAKKKYGIEIVRNPYQLRSTRPRMLEDYQ